MRISDWSSDVALPIYQSNYLVAGSLRSFPQDTWTTIAPPSPPPPHFHFLPSLFCSLSSKPHPQPTPTQGSQYDPDRTRQKLPCAKQRPFSANKKKRSVLINVCLTNTKNSSKRTNTEKQAACFIPTGNAIVIRVEKRIFYHSMSKHHVDHHTTHPKVQVHSWKGDKLIQVMHNRPENSGRCYATSAVGTVDTNTGISLKKISCGDDRFSTHHASAAYPGPLGFDPASGAFKRICCMYAGTCRAASLSPLRLRRLITFRYIRS
eukprot:TRINITY_DN2807_c0_g1_i3.p1 TRINITY_DN2807_c0_g1~~TRINITY_DN2807_c0_g1_i3.p1  ORF type:complete len:263 (+),score=4.29 TRINITY_DN2807_c0_g1_i3:2-790(+)